MSSLPDVSMITAESLHLMQLGPINVLVVRKHPSKLNPYPNPYTWYTP